MLKFLKKIYRSTVYKLHIILKKKKFLARIGNLKLFIEIEDPIERAIFFDLTYEKDQILTLIKIQKKHNMDYFLDIGSNIGYYALTLAKIFSKINVYAFEPMKKTYFKLIKNIKINNLENQIKAFNFGLSNRNKKVYMRALVKKNFIQSGGFTVHNPARELKSNETLLKANLKIGDEKIKFKNKKLLVKIDVEGHEIYVLNGLRSLINKNKIFLQIEIFNENYKIVRDFLKKNNFIFIKKVKSDYFFQNFKKNLYL